MIFWRLVRQGGQGCGSALALQALHDHGNGEGDGGCDGCRQRPLVSRSCPISLVLVLVTEHSGGIGA